MCIPYEESVRRTDKADMLMKMKVFKDRALSWMAILAYAQTTIIYLSVSGWTLMSMIYLGIGIVGVLILTAIDFKFIMPKEQKFLFGHEMGS